jgi:ElaA protein
VDVRIEAAPVARIDPVTLYRILQLRVDVFVVEQECPYPELDGRDIDPSTVLLWAERDGSVVGTLRILDQAGDEPGGTARIGRVVTARDARGEGIAHTLMTRALELVDGRDVELHAQSHLSGWYERYGFEVSGADYIDDGIAHTPMLRRAASSAAGK